MEDTMNYRRCLLFLGIVLVLGCDQDDFNKNEFRYVCNGVRISAPEEGLRIWSKYPPAYLQWIDSSKKGIEIRSNISNEHGSYQLHILIDSLTGKGVYTFPKVKAELIYFEGMAGFKGATGLGIQGELNLNYLNFTNGAAGYFYFMCLDTSQNISLPVTNGRFNLKWFKP